MYWLINCTNFVRHTDPNYQYHALNTCTGVRLRSAQSVVNLSTVCSPCEYNAELEIRNKNNFNMQFYYNYFDFTIHRITKLTCHTLSHVLLDALRQSMTSLWTVKKSKGQG